MCINPRFAVNANAVRHGPVFKERKVVIMSKHYRSNTIVKFAFAVIILFLIASVINMQFELKELKDRKAALEEEIQDVQDNIQEIKMRLDTPLTDEYIEKVAREKFGFRKPNEKIFHNNIPN